MMKHRKRGKGCNVIIDTGIKHFTFYILRYSQHADQKNKKKITKSGRKEFKNLIKIEVQHNESVLASILTKALTCSSPYSLAPDLYKVYCWIIFYEK